MEARVPSSRQRGSYIGEIKQPISLAEEIHRGREGQILRRSGGDISQCSVAFFSGNSGSFISPDMMIKWLIQLLLICPLQWPNVTCFVRTLRTNIRQIIRTDILWGNWILFVI